MKNSDIRERDGRGRFRDPDFDPAKPTGRRKAVIVPATSSPRAGERSDGTIRGKPTPRRETPVEPGRRDWYAFPKHGRCEGCGKRGLRTAHHVVRQSDLPAGYRWDVRNRMLLLDGRNLVGCTCHEKHHNYGVNDLRIPLAKVPLAAILFAYEVKGLAAYDYLCQRYRANPPGLSGKGLSRGVAARCPRRREVPRPASGIVADRPDKVVR